MSLSATMFGWALTGHGGPEKLVWREDLPRPVAGPGEVLIRVLSSSVNNTDINTRIGWYAKDVRGGTEGAETDADGGWNGALAFPLIQGIDCCGRIVAVGPGVDAARIGERVITKAMYRPTGGGRYDLETLGSERGGGFAQYMVHGSDHAIAVPDDSLPDDILGVVPCAYSTAESMLTRASVGAERILVTGASGGVGLAAVQLAVLRGAEVIAMVGPGKADAVLAAGAARTIGRDSPLPADLDAVVDLVGGSRWPDLLPALRPGGRYVTSGAIAGPIVELDLRDLYLRDLTLMGSTVQPDHILEDLVGYLTAGRLRPVIAARYDLRDMKAAQAAFETKTHVGKIALRVADDAD